MNAWQKLSQKWSWDKMLQNNCVFVQINLKIIFKSPKKREPPLPPLKKRKKNQPEST